jgi:two-component system chemotaxis family response regulator WspR
MRVRQVALARWVAKLGDAMKSIDKYPVMVLLVDDQAMIGEAVRRALAQHQGIDFHYCSDPMRAIEVAEHLKPTVILQDLIMPNVDGLTLVRQYRDHPVTRDIPIIVLSTKEEPAVKSEAFAVGANDYLVKLPDQVELVARLRYHSRAYVNQLQRDEAYRALRQSQKQLLEKNLELERLTNLDGLTGLSNRRYLDEYMAVEWSRAARERTSLSVLMLDVDDFKRYNDTYGHLAGDEVLKRVAEAIRLGSERPADLATRYGGEEFMVILPSMPHPGAQAAAEKLRRQVEQIAILHSGSASGRVTVSIGGASTMPSRGESALQLIEAADKALYVAKRGGKNCVVMHERLELAASPFFGGLEGDPGEDTALSTLE